MAVFWCLLLAVSCVSRSALSSEVLMVTMGGTSSHKVPFLALAQGLLERGHNVTLLSPFTAEKVSLGLVEVAPRKLVDYVADFTEWDLLGRRMKGQPAVALIEMMRYFYQACEALLSDPDTDDLLDGHYDLLILDGAYPECALGLVHHFNTPYMLINTVAAYTLPLSYAGNPAPYSVTPFIALDLSDEMTLAQKMYNTGIQLVATCIQIFMLNFFLEPMLRHRWPDMPPVTHMMKEASFILQNGHPLITYPRPLLPNVVDIGCIQCRLSTPLPKELEEFVSGGEGFIYVSMGTSVKTANMPERLRSIFVNVFAQLPYRVLWKWDAANSTMKDLPRNVLLSNWVPQQDVLGHNKILGFICHGGLLGVMEAVYHGVPVVNLPLYCDQDNTALKAEQEGYALTLQWQDITAEKLLKTVNTLIREPSYRASALNASSLLRDEPETPLSRAVFWTEFVLRHRGARHLQSPARHMGVVEYYMLDVVVVVTLLVGAAIKMLLAVIGRRNKMKQC